MEHKIEVSPSGRATCKSCKQAIAKGELRFGEAFQGGFSDEPAYRWHHLACAASKLAPLLAPVLAVYPGAVPDKAALEAAMAEGRKKGGGKASAFPNADRAPTGRAKCVACEAAIEKGAFRVAIEREVDTGSFVTKGPGYLHPKCALGFVEDGGLDEPEAWLAKVRANSVALGEADMNALFAELKK
jgi:hypothetical protein